MALIYSRKFWLLIIDTVVSIATYFITKYLGADGKDWLFLIGALQPIFVFVVCAIAYEDGKAKAAGKFPMWPVPAPDPEDDPAYDDSPDVK